MMPRHFIFLYLFTGLLLALPGLLSAQSVKFEWARRIGGILTADEVASITVDNSGNVYTTGNFINTVDFDPGPAVFNLTSTNGRSSFITKFTAAGNFIWAAKLLGIGVKGFTVKVDNSGNVYTAGSSMPGTDFDPGPAVYNTTGGQDIFFSKLDPSGNFLWAKSIGPGNAAVNYIKSIDIDDNGFMYALGSFSPSMDFDPGPGNFTMAAFPGTTEMFILKLDIAGNFVWAKKFDETFNTSSEPGDLAVDPAGNIYATGNFGGTLDFDPGPGIYPMTQTYKNSFVVKLNTNGELVWANHTQSAVHNSTGLAIAVDPSGIVYSGGVFFGAVDFNPGPQVDIHTSNLNTCFYILKLDATGNFLWARSAGGPAPTLLTDIAIDNSGDIYSTGNFFNTVDFDPGIISAPLSAATNGEKDVFILKLDAFGNYLWAKAIGGPDEDVPYSIAVDNQKSVYTTGTFETTADFDPAAPVVPLTSAGYQDIFIQKMRLCPGSTSSNLTVVSCNDYSFNNQTYTASGTYTYTIPNTNGCDSIITLQLTITKAFTTNSITICEGQVYFAGGANQVTAGTYIDTLQTTLGCDSVITTNLSVDPKPAPNLGQDRKLCLNDEEILSPGSFNSYSWQDMTTASTLTVNNSGTYWVTVMDANGCTATDSMKILSIDSLPEKFLPADKEICLGASLTVSVPGYRNYLWSTGANTDIITVKKFGTYYLSVTDHNNCTGKDTIVVTQKSDCIPFSIPNAFTPNRDIKNDIFRPTIKQDISDYHFCIFNRYGQKIFETNIQAIGWDGTFKGKEQPTGSYIFIVSYKNSNGWREEEKGIFLLFR